MIQKMTAADAPRVDAPVDGRIMHSESRFAAILLTLAPGETMAEHRNPHDVLFAGISGAATLVSGGQPYQVSAGETVFVSADEMRGWKNPNPVPFRVLVLKIH